VVLDADGNTVASWGRALWGAGSRSREAGKKCKHNFHISRSSLREALLEKAQSPTWGKQFSSFEQVSSDEIKVHFDDGTTDTANLLVAAGTQLFDSIKIHFVQLVQSL
jgi:hypothetical protein